MLSILCNYCPYLKEYNIDSNNITKNTKNAKNKDNIDNKDIFCKYNFCYTAFQKYLNAIENE